MATPTATFVCSGDDVAIFTIAWHGGALPDVTFTAPSGETRPLEMYISDGPSTDCTSYLASDTLADTGSHAVHSGANTYSFASTVLAAGTYELQLQLAPSGTMANAISIGSDVADTLNGPARFQIPFEWSAVAGVTVVAAPFDHSEDDAWQIPFEWSCIGEVEPVDDVEGDP